jgi:hypothetical protein
VIVLTFKKVAIQVKARKALSAETLPTKSRDFLHAEELLRWSYRPTTNAGLFGWQICQSQVQARNALNDTLEARLFDCLDKCQVAFVVTPRHADPFVLFYG